MICTINTIKIVRMTECKRKNAAYSGIFNAWPKTTPGQNHRQEVRAVFFGISHLSTTVTDISAILY